MRKLLIVLSIALLAVSAFAAPPTDKLEGTVFQETVLFTVGADTAFFTNDPPAITVGTAGRGAGYYGPLAVPISYNATTNELVTETRRVRGALFYSREPFSMVEYYPTGYGSQGVPLGALTSAHKWVQVDTCDASGSSGVAAGRLVTAEFPCWRYVAWPDSAKLKEAGSDTVRAVLGY